MKLAITGNTTLTQVATSTGANFAVTIDKAGVYELKSSNAAGAVICTQSVTVSADLAFTGPGGTGGTDGRGGAGATSSPTQVPKA